LLNKSDDVRVDKIEQQIEKLIEQQKNSNEAVVIIKDYLLDRQKQMEKKEAQEAKQLVEIDQKTKADLIDAAKNDAKAKKDQKKFESDVLKAINDVTPPEQDMTVFNDLKSEIIELQKIESETTLADTAIIFTVVIIIPLVTIYFIFNKIIKPFIH